MPNTIEYVGKVDLKHILEKLKDEIDKGGGGTSDYEQLTNLPSINNVEIKGNKTLQEYGGANYFKGTTAEVLEHYGITSIDDIPEGNITTITDIEPESYTLPIASTTELGGIKVGNNLSIDENGVLNATSGSSVASDISYNNTDSGLEASNVQDAIDEVQATSEEIADTVNELSGKAITTDNISQQSVAHATTADTATTADRAITADTATDDTKLPLAGGSISGDIKPDETGKYYIGTADNAFSGVYAKTIASRLNGGTYGSMNAVTEGTETTTGACRLTVGNSAASGTDKNAYGEIRLFNTGTNYVGLRTSNDLTANRTIYLPATSGTKTLAIDDEATTSTKGLLSASDKTKLDGIDTGANKVTLTTSGSGNAVTAISATNGALTVTKGTNFAARTGSASYDFNCKNLTANSATISGNVITGQIVKVVGVASSGGKTYAPTLTFQWVETGYSDGFISRTSNQVLEMSPTSEGYTVCVGVESGSSVWSLFSRSSSMCIGSASKKWGQIYSTKSTISTSDRKEKKNITIIDKAKEFIMKLKPVSYMFNNATSDRHHYGFIAQDVEEAMNELDMTSIDFGGLCKDLKEGSDDEYIYGLRYEEFIAPLVATVQQQQKEIDELKSAVEELKTK